MKMLRKIGPGALSLAIAAAPVAASATCANRDDMRALQAASLQQRLMVSAFQCKFMPQYNAFVLGHQPELQRYDAALLAFFKRDDPKGMATYNSYKTHLANIAALEDAHTNTFCAEVTVLYQKTSGTDPLEPLLDTLPPTDTAYASCVIPDSNAPMVASVTPAPVQVATVPEVAPQPVPPPAPPPVVASVAPAAPLTPPPVAEPPAPAAEVASQTTAAPPQRKPRAALRALRWLGGVLNDVGSAVGIGDDDKKAVPPPATAPAEASPPPAQPSSASAAPDEQRDVAYFDPNTPLVQDSDDSSPAFTSAEERRAARKKARREARRAARERDRAEEESAAYDDSYNR